MGYSHLPSPPVSLGEREWFFVHIKTCHFSELVRVFHGTLAEIPTLLWLRLLLTSPFH